MKVKEFVRELREIGSWDDEVNFRVKGGVTRHVEVEPHQSGRYEFEVDLDEEGTDVEVREGDDSVEVVVEVW